MSRCLWIIMPALLFCVLSGMVGAQEAPDPYANVEKARAADGAFVLGDPDAKLKLIAFSDFLCVSCQNYEPIISAYIWDYVLSGQAQFEYRVFPVVDPELSVFSAGLVECADTLSPGKFWFARDLMFDIVSKRGFTDETIADYASALDMDHEALRDCAAGANQHEVDAELGRRLGVAATPSLFAQYGDADPVPIALALPEHYPAIVNAIRPETPASVTVKYGAYAGLTAFRRADGGFVLGEPEAPLAVVAFEDFLCPHCQSYQTTVQAFIDEFVRTGQAQFEFRFYPLVDPQYSTELATLAECVGAQDLGKFWDAHDLLFGFAGSGNLDSVAERLSDLLGLDAAALEACQSRAIQFLIDTHLAQSALVAGTPAMRAREDGGRLEAIFIGDAAQQRGGLSIEQLRQLAEGSGAVSVGPPRQSLLSQYYLADTGLITGEPCAPPCWRSIVPGETSFDDAMAIVQGLDGIGEPQLAPDGFVFGRADGPVCCHISSSDSGSVQLIVLQFAPTMRFGDAIASYGEPLFYRGLPFSAEEMLLMFYFPDNAMLITTAVPGTDGMLDESSPIVGALYSTREALSATIDSDELLPWRGFAAVSEYTDA